MSTVFVVWPNTDVFVLEDFGLFGTATITDGEIKVCLQEIGAVLLQQVYVLRLLGVSSIDKVAILQER